MTARTISCRQLDSIILQKCVTSNKQTNRVRTNWPRTTDICVAATRNSYKYVLRARAVGMMDAHVHILAEVNIFGNVSAHLTLNTLLGQHASFVRSFFPRWCPLETSTLLRGFAELFYFCNTGSCCTGGWWRSWCEAHSWEDEGEGECSHCSLEQFVPCFLWRTFFSVVAKIHTILFLDVSSTFYSTGVVLWCQGVFSSSQEAENGITELLALCKNYFLCRIWPYCVCACVCLVLMAQQHLVFPPRSMQSV